MTITPDFERLHSGESISRTINVYIEEGLRDKCVKLGFITPLGKLFVSEALTLTDGSAQYAIPHMLLDGKGILLAQLLISDENGYIIKSPIEELPVYASVDDTDKPFVTDEGLVSIDTILTLLSHKAEDDHNHDSKYMKLGEGSSSFIVTGYADFSDGTMKNASTTYDEILSAVNENRTVKLIVDLGYSLAKGYFIEIPCTFRTNHEIVFDTIIENNGSVHVRAVCQESGLWTFSLTALAPAGHSHSYNGLTDKPTIDGVEIAGNITTDGFMFKGLLTSSDDLDSIFEDGVYIYSTSSLPKNAPFANAAVVEVFGAKSTSTQKIQRAYRYGEAGHSAFRPLYSGAWGVWSYPAVIKEATVTKTTSASGNCSLGVDLDDYVVLAAYCVSGSTAHICIPYRASTKREWAVRVINGTSMEAVTSASVEITYFYTKRN